LTKKGSSIGRFAGAATKKSDGPKHFSSSGGTKEKQATKKTVKAARKGVVSGLKRRYDCVKGN